MTWAIDQKGYSQRRACKLVGLQPKTYRYASTRPDDGALRARLTDSQHSAAELAATLSGYRAGLLASISACCGAHVAVVPA